MATNGKELIIYCDGEPIGVTTSTELPMIPPNGLKDWSKEAITTTETVYPQFTFTCGFKFDAPKEVKTEMEYYMNRKGTYYLRELKPPFRKIIFSVDEAPEDLKTLKYGTLIWVTVGYEDAKMTE